MTTTTLTLADLPINTSATITNIDGGKGFTRRLFIMGIRKGQTVSILCKQPLRGPLTIKACGCQMTLGRGMAQKIQVDVVQ
jgi:Fe2+ transport system protein FeoA